MLYTSRVTIIQLFHILYPIKCTKMCKLASSTFNHSFYLWMEGGGYNNISQQSLSTTTTRSRTALYHCLPVIMQWPSFNNKSLLCLLPTFLQFKLNQFIYYQCQIGSISGCSFLGKTQFEQNGFH